MPLSLEAQLNLHARDKHQREEPGWSVKLAHQNLLKWACDDCLAAKRAIKAKPWLQLYCCDVPLFAYVDSESKCESCGDRFTFSAEEKRLWYERYKFILASHPVNCLPCRRAKRSTRKANIALEEALHELDTSDLQQLVTVSDLYLKVGSSKKALEYLRRAKNLLGDPKEVAQLLERIAGIEDQPNLGVPADRDPRERGSRPLNTDR